MKYTRKDEPSGCLHLQREVVIVVLGEIQRLGLGRNTLAGIILEFPALFSLKYHAAFHAENLIFVQFGAVNAIFAGVGDFLSEQHSDYLN